MQFLEKPWKMRGNLEITAERRTNYLVSKPNYQTTKFFTENVLAIEMKTKKTRNIYEYSCLFRTFNTRIK